ncbi:MAG TPA: hypothetical protein VGK30_12885 [Candidatus Binatia bacterium]|jgi:hypothetical protein
MTREPAAPASSSPLPLDALAAAFRARTLPHAQWTHTAHLRVGAWHVHHHGADAALALLRTGIRALNDAHGTPNTATSGYHETITVAYVRLIAAFLAACPDDEALERRVARMLAGPLGERRVLLRYWSEARLTSEHARREWVPPDLALLDGCR